MIRNILNLSKPKTKTPSYSFSELNKFRNSFLTTTNLSYIQSLYQKWKQDACSVSPSFQVYFQLLENGEDPQSAVTSPFNAPVVSDCSSYLSQQLKIRMMIERYRAIGHQFAEVNPLSLQKISFSSSVPENVLKPEAFKIENQQTSKTFDFSTPRNGGTIVKDASINMIQEYLKDIYCSSVGYQYMHLLSKEERDFIKHQIEENIQTLSVEGPSKDQEIKSLQRLWRDQIFIDFLGKKFGNYKRFGIEGLNSAICGLEELVEVSAQEGIQKVVVGMAHRGRINTLHCVFGKPAEKIFAQFLQKSSDEAFGVYSGDVKYHLGYKRRKNVKDKEIVLEILPNPSHLQAVNPLVYGSVRATQDLQQDHQRERSMGVLIHGDAAMTGQGIVYESAEMHDLHDYTAGGIIHLVFNNQIGFTTTPNQGRSSYYCTEIAKSIGVPVFHVNANQPAVLNRCIRVAVQYRQKFKKDIFIDIVGYRRFGHNQQDQPLFTQPKMYQQIKDMQTIAQTYTDKLLNKNTITPDQVAKLKAFYWEEYQTAYENVLNNTDRVDDQVVKEEEVRKTGGSGVKKTILEQVFKSVSQWPESFTVHGLVEKIYKERQKSFEKGDGIDWATMESLAFGSLLEEGFSVRLSGQDVQRGTFSHRHALISDQTKDTSKHHFYKSFPANATICNSHLSEYGVMGFEYGYSLSNPNCLVIWEAQFGDFANGAAIIIDNFLTSGEAKWGTQSGLVLSLPHGMDGQGPEHSSARLERFLQLSDDNTDLDLTPSHEAMTECNIQVVVCSTSSNYFHVLRRQLARPFRKPLILFNSKKLLKHKQANCSLDQVLEGTEFIPVYGDDEHTPATKVLLCCGQFYYSLKERRNELNRKDIKIIRVEQLCPFPHQQIAQAVGRDKGSEICWVQEEHENYGGWNFMEPRLRKVFGREIRYYGRRSSASPAAGSLHVHLTQHQQLLNQIFT